MRLAPCPAFPALLLRRNARLGSPPPCGKLTPPCSSKRLWRFRWHDSQSNNISSFPRSRKGSASFRNEKDTGRYGWPRAYVKASYSETTSTILALSLTSSILSFGIIYFSSTTSYARASGALLGKVKPLTNGQAARLLRDDLRQPSRASAVLSQRSRPATCALSRNL